MLMTAKVCPKCSNPVVGKRSDAVYCGERCRDAVRQSRYAARDPEAARARCRRYSLSHRGTVSNLLRGAKSRAKEFGVPFDLDAAWLDQRLAPGVCELSGLPLIREQQGASNIHPQAPSLDRVKPRLGYVKTNVRIVCFAVNLARSDWGDEILMKVARALVENEKV